MLMNKKEEEEEKEKHFDEASLLSCNEKKEKQTS
jgi:hypothetical protein